MTTPLPGPGPGSGPGSGVASPVGRLPAGFQLGDYRLVSPLWPLRIADAYRAEGPAGPATVYAVHPAIGQHPQVRDQVVAGARLAAALPEHRNLVRTLAAGLTGDVLWIATEDPDGPLLRELLGKKRQAGAGLGPRAAGNLITGVAGALADVHHGALAAESIALSRTGRIRVVDLALGPATLAAIVAGLVPAGAGVAPECAAGAPPSAAADVFAIGALLYEALVGRPLERGGARPSAVVAGVNTQIDEIVARACHREPDKRFGRVDVLGEVVGEALHRGGAVMTSALPALGQAPSLSEHQASLASELATAAAPATADQALAAAVADTTEKWLVSRGRMDYGPFSLADVIAQIERGEIVAGNAIQDKDSGERGDVADHPLLGPIVDAARQRLDDQRRAQAEVKAQRSDQKRGALLYALIGAGVLGAAAAAVVIVRSIGHDDGARKAATVSALDGAELKVSVSPPTKPKPAPRRPTGAARTAPRAGGPGGDTLALDLSDDSDETETLDMKAVYDVYARAGGRLGGCLQSTGTHAAHIGLIIDGPSGRVTWVQVNDAQTGALHGCLAGVLRGLQFPRVHGPRTRAEFDLSM